MHQRARELSKTDEVIQKWYRTAPAACSSCSVMEGLMNPWLQDSSETGVRTAGWESDKEESQHH